MVNPVWEMFDKRVSESTSNISSGVSTLSELNQYLKMTAITRSEDPLRCWKRNSHVFPLLSSVAKVYLATVATSVPSERLFSKAGELISTRGNQHKLKTVDNYDAVSEQELLYLVFKSIFLRLLFYAYSV